MLIYNTTYLVSDRQFGPWLKWMNEEHIPFMLKTGYFTKPQVAKVLSADNEQEGTSVSVQFFIRDLYTLELWDEVNAEKLQDELSLRFGTGVLAFSTILEVME